MLHDVDVVLFRRRVHAPALHAACHVDHENRVAWFSISMHACGSVVPIVTGLRLVALGAAGTPLSRTNYMPCSFRIDIFVANASVGNIVNKDFRILCPVISMGTIPGYKALTR